MARLPIPGQDSGAWGDILNDYLLQSHGSDGSLKAGVVGSNQLQDDSVTADAIAPGSVTKSDVGLGNVDNTSDANKPISTAAQTALDSKLTAGDNLSDLASVSTARTNLGLGTAATQPTTAFAASPASPPVGDSLASLQTMVDQAAVGSRYVSLGAGTWELSGPLFVPSGVELAGVGDTTILQVTAGSPIISEGKLKDCALQFKTPSNLLSAGAASFTAGWTKIDVNSSATVTAYTLAGGRWAGSSILGINNNAGEDDYYQGSVSITGGTTYTVYAWQLIESYTAGAVGTRSLWINGSSTTAQAASTASSDVGKWRLRSCVITMGAADTTLVIRLYLPQGTVRWSDPVVVSGNASASLDSTADLLLGGSIERVSTPKNGNLRPTRRSWTGSRIAPRLTRSRNGNRPLRVAIFGDSIAERTDSASWMKFLSDPGSSDPSLFLGAACDYSPLPSDWTNRAVGGSTVHLVAAHLAVTRQNIDLNSGYNEMHLAGTAIAPPQLANMDLAILCAGQNGGEENDAWVETCTRLLRSANVDVILVATNPMSSSVTQGNDRALAYREIAEAHKCGLADLNTAFRISVAKQAAGRAGGYQLQDDGSDTVGLISDTVHPSLPGRKLYAEFIRYALVDAAPGAVTPPLTQIAPPTVSSYLASWPHVPRIVFDPVTGGTVSRETANTAANPRNGWADLTQASNGAYVLANDTAAAGSWANFLKFGTDGAAAVSLVIIGDGSTVSFDIAFQGSGSVMRSGVSVSTISGRVATVELYRLSDSGGSLLHRQMYVRCTTGNAKILGILLWEPGRAMRYRNPNDSSIQGVRFTAGTWSLANYRVFNGSTNGQLWGSDGNSSAFEFDFFGTAGYALLGGSGQAGGIVSVDVDGVTKITNNDLYSANVEPAYRRLEVTGLSPGFHTMRVYGTGSANASASASPGSQNSRRLIVAQVGSRFDNPAGYPEVCRIIN